MKIKNMKRNLVNAACIATAACTLAACGSSASSTTASSGATTTEASSAAETSEDTPLIGYSLNSMDSTMKTMADYFESVALERGWEPVLVNANGDVSTELNNMESLMNMGCDAVVIMGCDTEGSAAAIEELGAAGIPVIIAGRSINASEDSYYTYVAGDHHEAGEAQGNYLNSLLEADPNLTLNVAFIYGQSGSSSVEQRYQGFEDSCLNGEYKDRVNLVASQYAEFDVQKAYDITSDMLMAYDNINCFVTQSDEQASGIINAILILCAVIAVICSSFNAVIENKFNLPPFLVTLAMQQVFRGVLMLLSNGSPISNLNEGIIYMGQGYIGPIPFSVLLMLVFIVIGHIIFSRTQFGRNVIAVGGNPEAARVSGIDVNKTRVYVSALLGFTIAIMALVSCGRIASAQTTLGGDTVMDIIAAVVIGGTPMGGGSGTVVGTLFGCLVIGLISNGLNLLKVSSYWQMVSKGVIILVAVILDVYSERIYDRMRNKD